jgi:hypothetical protein
MIQHPACIGVEDAMRKLDSTVRTIWRDLEVLERTGFPLDPDPVSLDSVSTAMSGAKEINEVSLTANPHEGAV